MRPRILAQILPAILVLATIAHAQTTYRIAGTVVSGYDNHPLQRAPIQILDSTGQKPFQSTTSDEYGRFEFTGVPAGNFVLQGKAPGYLPTDYDQHEGYNTGIITGAGVDTESLVLKLIPEAVVTGTILNEAEEPVDNASVRLFRQSHAFGDGRIVSEGSANTDDLGHFEIPRLPPGTYFLAVVARPWYATRPQAAPEQQFVMPRMQTDSQTANAEIARQQQQVRRYLAQQAVVGVVPSFDPGLDVAYPVVYYPGGTDQAGAAPIVLHGGDTRDLNLQLTPQQAVTLTIPFAGPANGKGGGPGNTVPPQLRMSIFGELEFPNGQQMVQSQNETVITGIAAGDYVLVAPNQSGNSGGTPIHVTERSNSAALPPDNSLAHVHVQLKSADGSPLPKNQNLFVGLVRRHTRDYVSRSPDPKGEATLDVTPGDYYFSVETQQHHFFIRQIGSDSGRLPSNDLHLNAGDTPSFTLTFQAGTHILKGVARQNGKPFPGAFILLLPSAQVHEIRSLFFLQQSDLDGSFDIPGLAPGRYTLLAIDGGWDLDWQQDAVLSHYLPAATTLEIPEDAGPTYNLPQPLTVQPR